MPTFEVNVKSLLGLNLSLCLSQLGLQAVLLLYSARGTTTSKMIVPCCMHAHFNMSTFSYGCPSGLPL